MTARGSRHMVVLAAVTLGAVALVACGSTTDYSTRAEVEVAFSDTTRLVALGEEFLLADLLSLGVTPVASTATVAEEGFQGIGWFDTSAIEALRGTDPDLERLAALAPDALVATAFSADQLGLERLEGIAPTVVIPAGLDAAGQVRFLARAFDRVDEAESLIGAAETAQTDLAEATTGAPCEISLATVYPGPSVAAWTDGPTAPARMLLDAGCTLVPGIEAGEPDGNGRLFLSEEEYDLLSAPTLILLQSSTVEGEDADLAHLESDGIWAGLPAVKTGAVLRLDRLGYPGLRGEIELAAALARTRSGP